MGRVHTSHSSSRGAQHSQFLHLPSLVMAIPPPIEMYAIAREGEKFGDLGLDITERNDTPNSKCHKISKTSSVLKT